MHKDHIWHCFDEMIGVLEGYRPSVIIEPHIIKAKIELIKLEAKAELADAINWAIEFAKESGLRYDDIIMLSTEGWIIHSKEGVTTPLVEAYRNREEK